MSPSPFFILSTAPLRGPRHRTRQASVSRSHDAPSCPARPSLFPPVACEQPQPNTSSSPSPSSSPSSSSTPSASSPEGVPLGTSPPADAPRVNAALLQAMGDYFGDDGREVDDYSKRPRTAEGLLMLRVLIVGSGPRAAATARAIVASGRARGLYYCADGDGGGCVLDMEEIGAHSSTVSAGAGERWEDVVRFCEWAFVDVVFVSPDWDGQVSAERERKLANVGVTLFEKDISEAVADGTLSVDDCLATVSEELDAVAPPAEQLVE